MTPEALHAAALAAGATMLGDPPHFLFDLKQLARFVALTKAVPALPPLPYTAL